MGRGRTEGSEPGHIAETVFTAVTDGTDRLRYEAGADGIRMLDAPRAADDATFFAGIRARFGLAGEEAARSAVELGPAVRLRLHVRAARRRRRTGHARSAA
jgi:hypothetical protein